MKHFSMIRSFHGADLLTMANGGCGVLAVFHAMQFHGDGGTRALWIAAALVPLAIVFDVLDGRVARWRHRQSPMGRELDSLADLTSFGVAPAAIAYAVGLNTVLDQAILVYFVLCGLSRLARYNVTAESLSDGGGKVTHFEGTPIPTSILPLTVLLVCYATDHLGLVSTGGVRWHLTALLFAGSGSLMISKTLRVPKP
ncbi:MAG TPA: CDP-diacylglycerol--serine O-phosphatidyltransferase [Candidatus Dormibacteraeota bacterium]|nr:CDP-diacylglycerol--serine O-phosphatidyltransferase [Candidatus Dormibacteraeota bacterium]